MSEIVSFLSKDAQTEILNYIKQLEKIAGQYKVIAEGASNLQTEEQQKLKTEQELLKVSQEQEKLTKLKVQNLKNEQAATDKLNKALEKENSAYEKLKKQHREAIANVRELATKYGANSKQVQKATTEFEKLDKKLKSVNNTTGAPNTTGVGKYFQAIMKGAGALGLAVGAAQLFTKSFEALKNGSQTFGDAWARVMGSMTAATSTFFSMLGTGNFQDFTGRLKEAIKAGREYADALDDLFEGGLGLEVAEAKAAKFIATQQLIRDNVNLTNAERIEAAQKISEKEDKILNDRLVEAGKEYVAHAKYIEGIVGLDRDKLISFIENYREEEGLRDSVNKKIEESNKLEKARIQILQSGGNTTAIDNQIKAFEKTYSDEEKIYLAFMDKYTGATDDMIGNVIKSYANMTKLEATSLEERRRNENKLNTFIKEANKEKVKDHKIVIDETLESEEDFFDGLSALFKKNYDENKAQLEAKRKDEEEFQNYLTGIVNEKEKENIEAADKEIAEGERIKAAKLQQIEDIKQATAMALEATAMIGNEIFARNNMQRDAELQSVEAMYRDKMILAGEDKELQLAAEREARKERGKIAQEQAKADKRNALFNIAINTAQAVTMAWAQTGVFGIVAQLPVLAMGVLQAALVASRPLPAIPAYFKGTENSADTFIAGEKGAELGITKKGDVFLTPDKATLYSGMSGTKIIPNSETMQVLNAVDKPRERLSPKLDAIRKAVENSRTTVNIVNKYDARYEKRYQNMKA